MVFRESNTLLSCCNVILVNHFPNVCSKKKNCLPVKCRIIRCRQSNNPLVQRHIQYKPAKADQVEQPMDYLLDNQFDSHQISF